MDPQGSFTLSITSQVGGDLIAKAFLTCSPSGGSHPNPGPACDQLTKVEGRIEAIPEKEGSCPEIFDPVILTASGTWDGKELSFERKFPNRCLGVLGTGGVIFDFEGVSFDFEGTMGQGFFSSELEVHKGDFGPDFDR